MLPSALIPYSQPHPRDADPHHPQRLSGHAALEINALYSHNLRTHHRLLQNGPYHLIALGLDPIETTKPATSLRSKVSAGPIKRKVESEIEELGREVESLKAGRKFRTGSCCCYQQDAAVQGSVGIDEDVVSDILKFQAERRRSQSGRLGVRKAKDRLLGCGRR